MKAASKHIGKKKVDFNSKPWMNQEIRENIKEGNRRRKTGSESEETRNR